MPGALETWTRNNDETQPGYPKNWRNAEFRIENLSGPFAAASVWEDFSMIKAHISALATVAAAALLSTGCNTIQGAGKDLERGGQVIRDTAKDVQKRF